MELKKLSKPQAVEQLVFLVSPEDQDDWMKLDHEIWTKGLAAQPGFMGKEIWKSRENPSKLTVTVFWSDYEDWKAIDDQWLVAADKEFTERFAPRKAELIGEYHNDEQNFKIAQVED